MIFGFEKSMGGALEISGHRTVWRSAHIWMLVRYNRCNEWLSDLQHVSYCCFCQGSRQGSSAIRMVKSRVSSAGFDKGAQGGTQGSRTLVQCDQCRESNIGYHHNSRTRSDSVICRESPEESLVGTVCLNTFKFGKRLAYWPIAALLLPSSAQAS